MLSITKSNEILNALLNTSKLTSSTVQSTINAVSFGTDPYLALFKALPDGNGANYEEVMTPTATSEYHRVLLTNKGAYNKQIMAAARKVTVGASGAVVTVTLGTAAPEVMTYKVTATVSGADESLTVTVAKGATTGTETASGTVTKVVFDGGFGGSNDTISEAVNQDLVTFPECRATAWSTQENPVIGYGIFSAAQSGTLLFWGELENDLVIAPGTIPIFRVGELRLRIF